MARIDTYSNDNTIELNDKVIGTDSVGEVTKNFTMSKIVQFVQSETFIVDNEENEFDLNTINTKYSSLNNGSFVFFPLISPVIAAIKVSNLYWITFNVNIFD